MSSPNVGPKRTRSPSDAQNLPQAQFQRVDSDDESSDEGKLQLVTAKYDEYLALLDKDGFGEEAWADEGLREHLWVACEHLVEAASPQQHDAQAAENKAQAISTAVVHLLDYGQGDAAQALLEEAQTGYLELDLRRPGFHAVRRMDQDHQIQAFTQLMKNVKLNKLSLNELWNHPPRLKEIFGATALCQSLKILEIREVRPRDVNTVKALEPLFKGGSLETLSVKTSNGSDSVEVVEAFVPLVSVSKCIKHLTLDGVALAVSEASAMILEPLKHHESLISLSITIFDRDESDEIIMQEPLLGLRFCATCPKLKAFEWSHGEWPEGHEVFTLAATNPLLGTADQEELFELAETCKLEELTFHDSSISPHVAEGLLQRLAMNGCLQKLNLWGTPLPINAVKTLADCQFAGGTLKVIKLTGLQDTDDIPEVYCYISKDGGIHEFEQSRWRLKPDVPEEVVAEFKASGMVQFIQNMAQVFLQQGAAIEMAENVAIQQGVANFMAEAYVGLTLGDRDWRTSTDEQAKAKAVEDKKAMMNIFVDQEISKRVLRSLVSEAGASAGAKAATEMPGPDQAEIESDSRRIASKYEVPNAHWLNVESGSDDENEDPGQLDDPQGDQGIGEATYLGVALGALQQAVASGDPEQFNNAVAGLSAIGFPPDQIELAVEDALWARSIQSGSNNSNGSNSSMPSSALQLGGGLELDSPDEPAAQWPGATFELWQAALKQDDPGLIAQVEGLNVNPVDDGDANSLLLQAGLAGCSKVVEWLLDSGALDLNGSVLKAIKQVKQGDAKSQATLLLLQAHANAKGILAIQAGSVASLDVAVAEGWDVKATNSDGGNIALLSAVEQDTPSPAIVSALLENGATDDGKALSVIRDKIAREGATPERNEVYRLLGRKSDPN